MEFAQVLVTVPAIAATVQWLKSAFNMSGRWCQLAAVLVGVLFSYLYMVSIYTFGSANDASILINFGVKGFMYGLAAAGFYDLASGSLKSHPADTREPETGASVDDPGVGAAGEPDRGSLAPASPTLGSILDEARTVGKHEA